jgi:hypothetical protein
MPRLQHLLGSRNRQNPTFLQFDEMTRLILLSIVLFFAAPAGACNQPLPYQGGTCPLGYYRSGNYCIPSR